MRLAIFLVLLAAATLYAFRRGGTPEKQVAGILLAIQLTDMIYHHVIGGESRYGNVDAFHTFNDGWALVATLFVALTANRFWPLWIAAFQVIAFGAHYVRATDLSVPPLVYAIMIRAPIWTQIVTLVVGTWSHVRQRGRAAPNISPVSSRG